MLVSLFVAGYFCCCNFRYQKFKCRQLAKNDIDTNSFIQEDLEGDQLVSKNNVD